jgi:NAD(P)-dependent dehydrogenase (short-subunit alcohol dehydrogenase family)
VNILITGGSSGLGKATVENLALDKNNAVWFTYNRHKEEAEKLIGRYANVKATDTDFTDDESVNKLIIGMSQMDLDVLINNAYIGKPQGDRFHKTKPEEFMESFNENIVPTIKITQKAIEIFKSKKFGKIINIVTSALLGTPPIGYSIYAGNKAYLQELTKIWAKEYARFNITSNCIAPEYMTTEFANVDKRIIEQMRDGHPLKKLLEPKEVAEFINYLIKSTQQINGVTFPINATEVAK